MVLRMKPELLLRTMRDSTTDLDMHVGSHRNPIKPQHKGGDILGKVTYLIFSFKWISLPSIK